MKLLFTKCGCDWSGLARVPREWWMRLLPARRLYYCRNCRSRILAVRTAIEGTAEWQAATTKLFMESVSRIHTPS